MKKMYDRITMNSKEMGRIPCIRDIQIPVALIIILISEGLSEDEIIEQYPKIEKEDFPDIIRYALNLFDKNIPDFLKKYEVHN
jgi:uncharacterized protein (DUF433 family)